MSDIMRTSFYYDPVRQGYDTNSWRTLAGAPETVPGGRLMIDSGTAGTIIHYADILKGDIRFNLNIPVDPATGSSNRIWGLHSSVPTTYIRFNIGSNVLVCQTANGADTSVSSAIAWDAAWSGANVLFRIQWEAGTAKFFINNSQVYAVSDASVPHGPLSLYLSDNSDTGMSMGNVLVLGTVSYVKNSATTDTRIASLSPSISPSASLSRSISPSVSPSASLSASISPSVSPSASLSRSISSSVSPSASLSRSISPSFSPSLSKSISASLSRSISPSVSPSASLSASLSPSISPSPSPSMSPSP